MHLIPADAAVARTLRSIRAGQTVRLESYLVEVTAKDGWLWRSSLSRDGSGQGGCEVVFVQAVVIS